MSVVWKPLPPMPSEPDGGAWRNEEGFYHEVITASSGGLCWYCGELLSYPFVVWMGIALLCLHSDCATTLGTKLIGDGYLAAKPSVIESNARAMAQ